MQKEKRSKNPKRGKKGTKKTYNTHLHTQRAVFLARAFIPRERTHGRRERNIKKSERRAPTLFLPLCRSRACDGRPSSPSVGRLSSSRELFFFFSLGSQKIPPLSQKSVGSSFGKGVALYARFTTRVDSSTRKKTKRTRQTRVELSFGTDFTSRNRRERRKRMRNVPFFASFFLPARLRYLRVIFSRSLQLCSRVRATFFF